MEIPPDVQQAVVPAEPHMVASHEDVVVLIGDTEMPAKLVAGLRGRRSLYFQGFSFNLKRMDASGTLLTWYCNQWHKGCKVKAAVTLCALV